MKKHLQANAQLQEASNRAAEARLEDQQSRLIWVNRGRYKDGHISNQLLHYQNVMNFWNLEIRWII